MASPIETWPSLSAVLAKTTSSVDDRWPSVFNWASSRSMWASTCDCHCKGSPSACAGFHLASFGIRYASLLQHFHEPLCGIATDHGAPLWRPEDLKAKRCQVLLNPETAEEYSHRSESAPDELSASSGLQRKVVLLLPKMLRLRLLAVAKAAECCGGLGS